MNLNQSIHASTFEHSSEYDIPETWVTSIFTEYRIGYLNMYIQNYVTINHVNIFKKPTCSNIMEICNF